MADMRLGIEVDTDTRATRREFSDLRREVKREADGMGGDWEAAAAKVEDALREAGARDDLVDAARRIGEQGPTEIEKMRSALRDVGTAGEQAGDDVQDGLDGIKRAVEDNAIDADDIFDANFAAEVRASARETGGEILGQIASSIAEGDLSGESLGVALSEGLVEIGAELGGPAGAAAVAGGLIGASIFGAMAREREELQESVNEMFETWVEKGAAASEALFIESNIKDITQDVDRLNEAQRVSAETGISLSDILRAMAGDAEAWNSVYERTGDLSLTEAQNLLGVEKAYRANREAVDATKAGVEAYHEAIDALPNKKGTDVNVDDHGTASRTQGRIDNLRGRDIPVSVYVSQSSIDGVYNTVSGIRLPAIVVQARLGQAAL